MTSNGSNQALAQIQRMLNAAAATPEMISETVVHTLYPTLSEGAANTYGQLGRGVVLMDLRALDAGKLDTSYVSAMQLHRINDEFALFNDAQHAVASYDPQREFIVIVWQTTLIMIYRLQQL